MHPFLPLLSLAILFLIINGTLFARIGIMTDADTVGYFTYAEEIKEQGLFYKEHHFFYIGYVLFILLTTAIYNSVVSVVIGQYILSFIALICLYKASLKLFANPAAAWITCVWFLGFFMIQFWNLYLYAESLLISLHCISFYFVAKWYKGEINLTNGLIGSFVILTTIFTKPTGMGMLVALLAVGIYILWQKINHSGIKWAFSLTVVFVLILLFNKMLATAGFIEEYQIGEIVYNIYKMEHKPYAKYLMLTVPENLYIPNQNQEPIIKLAQLVLGNPWYTIKLFFIKLFYFVLYIRPYYSWMHNVLALMALLPMYFGFISTLRSKRLKTEAVVFIITFIVFSTITVCLMTINWNSRFLMPMLPLVFLIGGLAVGNLCLKSFFSNRFILYA